VAESLRPRILVVGFDAALNDAFSDVFTDQVEVIRKDYDKKILSQEMEPAPQVVICGPFAQGYKATEIARALRGLYSSLPIFHLCTAREGFDRVALKSSGFTDAFLLPIDRHDCRQVILETLSRLSHGQIRAYRQIHLIDLQPGEILDFDTAIYMPANYKYVQVGRAGEEFDQTRFKKFIERGQSTLYVPSDQIHQFYHYASTRLRMLTQTQRREQLGQAVRGLLNGLIFEGTDGDSASQKNHLNEQVIEECEEIVRGYIRQSQNATWYERVAQVVNDAGDKELDQYTHSGNVSTLATLFSIGLGVGRPEELACAGLLHDLGLEDLPQQVRSLEPEAMNREQFRIYATHPELSCMRIKATRLGVPESVLTIIFQHHELFNGQGYPNGLSADQIRPEAQILSLADRFDEMTRVRRGQFRLMPKDALAKLSQMHYDPRLIRKLIELFGVETTEEGGQQLNPLKSVS